MKQKNEFGTTDYDIPVFSLKSAVLIVGLTMVLTVVISWITSAVWARNLTISITLSLTVAYSRYFIDTDRKLCKGFYLTAAVIFLAVLIVLCFVK